MSVPKINFDTTEGKQSNFQREAVQWATQVNKQVANPTP